MTLTLMKVPLSTKPLYLGWMVEELLWPPTPIGGQEPRNPHPTRGTSVWTAKDAGPQLTGHENPDHNLQVEQSPTTRCREG